MGKYSVVTCKVCKKKLPANKMRPVGDRFVCSRACQKSLAAKSGDSAGNSGGGIGKLSLLGIFWPWALMGTIIKSKHGLKIFAELAVVSAVGTFIDNQRSAAPPSDAEIEWATLNAEAITAEEARLTKLQAEIMDHLASGEPELASIKITALVWDPNLKNPYRAGKRDPHEKK